MHAQQYHSIAHTCTCFHTHTLSLCLSVSHTHTHIHVYTHTHTSLSQPLEVENTDSAVASPSMFSSVSHAQGRALLTRLAKTTLNSVRTVTKVTSGDTNDMGGVKMNLTSQLTAAMDDCDTKSQPSLASTTKLNPAFSLPGHTHPEVTSGKIEGAPFITNDLLQRDHFYMIEPELCDILGGGGTRCIGGRGQCHSPIAGLLDRVYFIPIK